MNQTRNGSGTERSANPERVRGPWRNLAAENARQVEIDGQTFEVAARWDPFGAVDQVTVTALSRGGRVTPRTLKRVPLGGLLDDMRREMVAASASEAAGAPEERPTAGAVTRADVEAMRSTLGAPPPRKRPGPKGTPDAVLRRVADVYRAARDKEDPRPVVTVAEIVGREQGVEHDAIRQAQSWVKIARRRGYLEPGMSNERRNDG